jgi:hypothetical protein
MDQASRVAGKIGVTLRNPYVLGYRPPENTNTSSMAF